MANPVIAANKVAAQQRRILDTLSAQSAPKILAYHGSPHYFDRFDASKIGTGEGAQAYGYGLYFAGNEKVAIGYRDRLRSLVGGPIPGELWDELHGVIEEIQTLRARKAAASGDEYKTIKALIKDALTRHADVSHRIREASYIPGHVYEVELGVPEESLLDYDQPFSNPAGIVGAEVLRQDNPVAVSANTLRAIQDGSWRGQSFRGRSPYSTAAWELKNMARTREGSQALLEAGIPGVRYLDGNSRGVGEGTRNYVMFPGTEDRIRILRKYGLLGPAAAGTLGDEE